MSWQKVTFLGPPGTYSHQIAAECFPNDATLSPISSILGLFDALRDKSTDFAVIPIENSTFGPVNDTYDSLRLLQSETSIQGDATLEISHCLLVKRGTTLKDIKTIYTHEMAMGQCRNYLAAHLPNAQQVTTPSTAGAAERILSLEHCAAIASKVCLDLHPDLVLLDENIQDRRENFTRFLVLSNGRLWTKPHSSETRLASHAFLALRTDPSSKDISHLFSFFGDGTQVLSITRRPSSIQTVFHDEYFVEVRLDMPLEVGKCHISHVIDGVRKSGGSGRLLGFWSLPID
ncbi:PDT-domain-containing protein [Flagelloscypha sp. PMI_526]|nr:PDT-domain-containing protein [Flagelloscypha sp. PMI_526]